MLVGEWFGSPNPVVNSFPFYTISGSDPIANHLIHLYGYNANSESEPWILYPDIYGYTQLVHVTFGSPMGLSREGSDPTPTKGLENKLWKLKVRI